MVISPVHYIAVPLLAAFLIPLLSKFIHKELARIVPGIVFLYSIFISITLMLQIGDKGIISEVIAGWQAPWGINLVFSPFSGFLASLMSIIGFLIWLYSYNFKKIDKEQSQKYHILQMMMVTGAIGIVLTGDIFNLFVFMEITAITAYSLTSFYRERDGAEAGFKYLLIGSFASVLILLAIMILYTQLGTLNMAEIAQKSHLIPTSLKTTIIVLFLVGFGIEAEMFPLNGWAPDAYSQSPGPIGAAFAGIVVKAGVYALVRVIFTLFDIHGAYDFLIYGGLITMIIAETSALAQTNLKRMLAYSSIGQMGFVLMAFGIGTHQAIVGALFLMFNHAIIKSLLFMSGSYLTYNSLTKQISALSGLGKKLPLVSILFGIGAFAIVGLPPFSGFWSKLYVLSAAADKNMLLLIMTILAVSIVEIIYYFRVVSTLYYGKQNPEIEIQKPSINAMVSMIALGITILVVGVYPDVITNLLENAATALTDKATYIQSVLTQNLPIN
jgi:proton-translocating NADH-quinone oxidoreductase chain M